MKHVTFGQWLCRILWLVQLAVEAVAAAAVWKLNMLPIPYFAALLAGMGLLLGITGLLLRPFGKKRVGAFRRILGWVLTVAVIIGCAFAWRLVTEVSDVVEGITDLPQTTFVSMAVYVLNTDPARSISDAENYLFAALADYEAERTRQTLDQIRQTLGKEIGVAYYKTLTELLDALDQGKVNALVLNSAYVSILEETEEYSDLSQRLRILHIEQIEETLPPETQPPTETESQPTQAPTEEVPSFSVVTDSFIVYVSGSDTRDYYLSTSRSDVNILVAVNPVSKTVLLINTPRDTWISNPAGGGAKDKLTHCGIYGIDCSIGALEKLYGIDVQYHAQINFTGVETLVDAIGGVDVYSEYGFHALGRYWIDGGWNHLNGQQALAFARDRKSHADGDHARGRNQMKVIRAVLEKATSGTTILENYPEILGSIQGMFRTNMSAEEIGALIKMQLGDMASWNVVSYALTGEGASDITYSMPGLYCYVMYPYESRVAYASELIDRLYAGEVLTDEDMTLPRQ